MPGQALTLSQEAIEEAELTSFARQIHDISRRKWGETEAVVVVGRHPSIRRVQSKLRKLADTAASVVITGETGVGKELFARALYLLGRRRRERFYRVNCGKYSDSSLLTSELFGHKRGSFTGAVDDREGLFEAADGGMLFLDEISELSMEAQAKLLRVLGEGEIVGLGRNRSRKVNVRVVAATNENLAALVREGTFRRDLYFRLRQAAIRVPPLRERGEDWRRLTRFFLACLREQHSRMRVMSDGAWEVLARYDWPGNVRELQSIVFDGFILSEGPEITSESLRKELERSDPGGSGDAPVRPPEYSDEALYARMVVDGEDFWSVIREPFLDREISRYDVRPVIARGLRECRWCYKELLELFNVGSSGYTKFMDFLRHHRLKPPRPGTA